MPDWFKTFFDTYANVFAAVGTIATVLALVWGFYIYFRPRTEPVATGKNVLSKRHGSSLNVTAIGARGKTWLRLAYRWLRPVGVRLWYRLLYYLPGIRYEVPEVEIVDDRLAAELRTSTVFYAGRFADAFPAVRTPTAFDQISDIAHRLGILLRPPLSVWTSGRTRCSTPLYWLGGLGNLHIERWTRIKPRLFLMDVMELDIARIVVIPGTAYWQNFVYVECRALAPTGLYGPLPGNLVGLPDHLPSAEEYAVYGHRLVTRREYDDGGYVRRGRVRQFKHQPQLRVRHLVPFNFLIVPVMSPANRSELDGELAAKLADCLRTPSAISDLADWLLRLPKRQDREN